MMPYRKTIALSLLTLLLMMPQRTFAHGFSGPSIKWYDFCWIIPSYPFIALIKYFELHEGDPKEISVNKTRVRVRGLTKWSKKQRPLYRSDGSHGSRYDENISSCFLEDDAALPVGSRTVLLQKHKALSFYRSGRLHSGTLIHETGLSAGGRELSFIGPVSFYEDNTIECGMLSKEAKLAVRGTPMIFTGLIRFFPDGSVRSGLAAADCKFNNGATSFNIPAGSTVTFYRTGALERIRPGKIFHLEGRSRDVKLTDVSFYPGGELKGFSTVDPVEVSLKGRRIQLKEFSRVWLKPDGDALSISNYGLFSKTRETNPDLQAIDAEGLLSRYIDLIYADLETGTIAGYGIQFDHNNLYLSDKPLRYLMDFDSDAEGDDNGLPVVCWITYSGLEDLRRGKRRSIMLPRDMTVRVDGKKIKMKAFEWKSID